LAPGLPSKRPVLTRAGGDVVTMASSSTVTGLEIDPAGPGSGIAAGPGVAGAATITDVRLIDSADAGTEPALEISGTSGTFAVRDLTVLTPTTGVKLSGNSGSVVFEPTGTFSITSTGSTALAASTTPLGTSTFDVVEVSGSSAGGIQLVDTSGTI